ncbi:hypothetical protein J2Z76_002695 [Sedimentibacter acidaminivorans]|uniref:Uncharacterized protein n=1 Tax=Sedimentibacter acidaminivorans TaxID=913099 RepID=A0ABS4GGK2_9FIRM|nr:hypothetical protein [Sedimentibacter acidaminivorans]MBP1926825.1 hypothetical protein [Sedimentibacter acidaminivorans]
MQELTTFFAALEFFKDDTLDQMVRYGAIFLHVRALMLIRGNFMSPELLEIFK